MRDTGDVGDSDKDAATHEEANGLVENQLGKEVPPDDILIELEPIAPARQP